MAKRPEFYLQRSLVLTHLAGLALLFGGTAAVVLTGFAADRSSATRAFAFELALQLQHYVLLPGFTVLVLSGVLLSATGPWGFFRHWWMVGKLVGTFVLTMHGQFEYRPLTGRMLELAKEAAISGALPADWADQFFHFQRVGFIQLGALVLVSALGVFKPLGKTPFSRPQGKTSSG